MIKRPLSLQVLILIIGIMCILLGSLVLLGWYTRIVELIQVLPMFVPMQYNTAMGFLLSGIGLLLIFRSKLALVGKVLFAMVGTIGLLTLMQYILGVNINIDELLMEHYITVETSHPGRMAPNTALCFLLSSIAMLLSLGKGLRKLQISGILGALILGLGIIAFIGYLIGMEVTFGGGKLTRMAVHTAIGFMAMGIGITAVSFYKEKDLIASKDFVGNIWFTSFAFALALIIFCIDLSLPMGVAMGISYILFVLFAWYIKQDGITTVLALCSSVLIIAGYLYSAKGADSWVVILIRSFALLAVWMVAGLLSHIQKKEKALNTLNSALNKNIVQLNNKNKELEQFTFIASHDLQEPLRTVINFTDLFKEHQKVTLDEDGEKYLSFISQASRRMSMLIKGLLDYSRIGGKGDKKSTMVDCNELLEIIQVDRHTKIDETGTVFQIDKLPKLRAFPVEFRVLFQNLITNAIKFQKKNSTPSIKIAEISEERFWKFSIHDNGNGIAKNHLKKIFSIFQRLHTRAAYEGTGIGLAHCQKFVELHQGNIWVTSKLGEGSTFFFSIKK